jgi:hypothetical protein
MLLEREREGGFMPKYWAVVTVDAGPTLVDITLDRTYIPLGPSDTGGLGGHRVVDSAADPVPFVFHARGIKGFPVTLAIVLSPLPSGADIKFNSQGYKIPESGILTVDDGKIPIKTVAAANVQLAMATVGNVAVKTPAKKAAPAKAKRAATKGSKGK